MGHLEERVGAGDKGGGGGVHGKWAHCSWRSRKNSGGDGGAGAGRSEGGEGNNHDDGDCGGGGEGIGDGGNDHDSRGGGEVRTREGGPLVELPPSEPPLAMAKSARSALSRPSKPRSPSAKPSQLDGDGDGCGCGSQMHGMYRAQSPQCAGAPLQASSGAVMQ